MTQKDAPEPVFTKPAPKLGVLHEKPHRNVSVPLADLPAMVSVYKKKKNPVKGADAYFYLPLFVL